MFEIACAWYKSVEGKRKQNTPTYIAVDLVKQWAKGKNKQDPKDENTCEGCRGQYDSDAEEEQETWIGGDKRGCLR